MRFAFIIDDYMPHSTRVGAKMFHELALEFKKHGHEVVVITPAFGQDKILKIDDYEDVTVWRFKSPKLKDISKVKRAVNESLLSINGWRAVRSEISENFFDGVVSYSPSIFFGFLIKKIKKRCECPSYLILRDLFPQWAVDAGLIKHNSSVHKYFKYFECQTYSNSDYIGLMSENNIKLFNSVNPELGSKVKLLRNWASYSPVKSKNRLYREKLNLSDKVVFFYGGNIGHAQDMANLMRLVKNMSCYHGAHFLFVGQGDQVSLINELADEWGLRNFTYLSSVDQYSFKKILSETDVGLFSLASTHTSHNFPGKLLGYMVESKPILGSVNINNDLMDIVNYSGAGFVHYNGDDQKLFKSAEKLFIDHKLRVNLGSNASDLLVSEFSVEAAYNNIYSSLVKI